jgi:hypothetical protein
MIRTAHHAKHGDATMRAKVWMAVLCTLSACSSDIAMGRRCSSDGKSCVGTTSADGGSAGSAASNTAGTGSIDNTGNALTVHVEDIAKMTIEVITLTCAGDCADIEAVAKGGNPAYHFKWEDGSTNAKRHVCLDASAKLSVEVTDTAIDTDELGYEAHTVSSEVTAKVIACGTDGGVIDAGKPSECEGELVTSDINGGIVYFAGGAALPSRRYRVTYFDGCMKFGAPVNWTVHNFIGSSWFLVRNSSTDALGTLPGTAGIGYPVFDDCVTANRALAPLDIDFQGGKLGVWLSDSPYDDNIAGENGQNPRWCLKALNANGTP